MTQTIGIDLGTTYSSVAVLRSSGKPEVLKNQDGDPITPSVVLFQNFNGADEPLVGTMAKHSAATSPLDTIQFVKRHMGDPHWRFDSSSGATYTPEEISAIILKRLKQDAELALGESVTDAVITVPAYFDDARRMATKHAGKIAGLNVLGILNEPTAAALSYGLDTEEAGTVLVYDLGGGTFDVTIMKIEDGDFESIATEGDRNLGGFDFDNALMKLIANEMESQGARKVLEDMDATAALREKAEMAKRALTTVSNTNAHMSFEGKQYRVQVSRSGFEEVTRSLLNRTQELVEDVLEAAGMTWNQIDHVLLVGGSTRMPMVREMVQKISGKPIELNVNPDEAVALGAAIKAAILNAASSPGDAVELFNGREISISDVASQALGVITVTGPNHDIEKNTVVIPRNSKIPGKYSTVLSTVVANQTALNVRVTQGDDEDPDFVTVVGESTLSLPAYPADSPIRVTYHYDIDQTIFVEVDDLVANKSLGTFEIDRLANMDNAAVTAAVAKLASISVS